MDLDVTSSNEEEDVFSINSEEFNDRHNNTDEHAHDNRLCDICTHAQQPSKTAVVGAWVFRCCNTLFHLSCGLNPQPQFHRFHCVIYSAMTEV